LPHPFEAGYNGLMLRLQFIIVTLIAVLWSAHPAILASIAYLTLPKVSNRLGEDSTTADQEKFLLSRKLQLHFLKYRIYIPLEDISFSNPSQVNALDKGLSNFPGNSISCDFTKNLIWVPFRFKVPVIGERVLQWCLKIPLENLS
jgi:hypothetical protein